MTEQNQTKDESNDRSYFTITPRLVGLLCEDPYEYTLWGVIKEIAGEDGECFLSTPDLATLAMQSTGKVSQSRARLIKIGLLDGEIRRDPGFQQPVWHLRIPDLWAQNIAIVQDMPLIKDRVEFKRAQQSLHQVKASPGEEGTPPGEEGTPPGEEGTPPGEEGTPPGETKKIQQRTIEEPEVDPITATSVAETPATPPENSPRPGLGEALENLERLDNLDRLDYLDHLADLNDKTDGAPWTVPVDAGGADGLGEAMLDAWLEQKGVLRIPDQLRAKWSRRLSKLALDSGLMCDDDGNPALTREQAIRAVEIVLEPGSAEFGYYTYNDPANRKFQQDWTEIALRLLNGGTGYKDNGDPSRRGFNPATDWHDDDCPEIEVNGDGTLRSHI